MTKQTDSQPSKLLWAILLCVPIFMFGLFGFTIEFISKNGNPMSGMTNGVIIGIIITLSCFMWLSGWDWVKNGINEGKLSSYLFAGVVAAIIICSYLAYSLGEPSCNNYEDDGAYSTCTDYADNGYKVSSEQRWEKFWSSLPVTVLITSLIAALIQSNMRKN